MKRIVLAIILLLLWGSVLMAQSMYDRTDVASLTLLPVTTDRTDRSVTVYDRRFFDLETEIPFRRQPRMVRRATEAQLYAHSQYREGVTVVENCAVLPIGEGMYRHPETLKERLNASCIRYGYVEPPKQTLLDRIVAGRKK